MASKPLRAVGGTERVQIPPTLAEAVESGNVLDMLLAQRRLMADALTAASENTQPQFNQALTKLHVLIREEEARQAVEEQEVARRGDDVTRKPFDATAI